MKRIHQFNSHIDGLPEELVGKILTHLPIQDAVRTSILSRKWRYGWTGLPKLVFDDKFCEESILKTESKLINAIDRVIFLHEGPLESFILSISYLKSSCPEIDQFVLVVLKKGVKDLILRLGKDEPYKLPSSVFLYGQQLKHLQLQSCEFKPPPGFNGFSKLIHLELDEVVGITGSRFSSIISHCPVLESLTLSCCSIGSSPIDITAPNLKYLGIKGLIRPLCFRNTPKLSTVVICSGILEEREASMQSILSGRLPVVENLALDDCCLECLASNRPSALLVKDLCHLKFLCLLAVSFAILDGVNDVFSALCLIRNCPNLEKLEIFVYTDHDTTLEVDLAEAEDIFFDHLKMVEFHEVSGLKCELQLIKLILAKSPVLEKFLIIPDSNFVGDEELKIFKELSTFQWASPLVEITYEG